AGREGRPCRSLPGGPDRLRRQQEAAAGKDRGLLRRRPGETQATGGEPGLCGGRAGAGGEEGAGGGAKDDGPGPRGGRPAAAARLNRNRQKGKRGGWPGLSPRSPGTACCTGASEDSSPGHPSWRTSPVACSDLAKLAKLLQDGRRLRVDAGR